MATKKISELPLVNRVSGSQVAGGSVLPIVIGGGIQGTTNQISVEDFSLFVNAYNATTGSNTFIGNQIVTGNVSVSGRLTVNELVAQYETSSILFSTGSTKLGDQLTDKHEITGSTNITGSLTAIGFITLNGQSLNNAFDRIHQTTHSLQLATSSLQAHSASVDNQLARVYQTTQSLHVATASLQFHSASVDAQLLAIQQTTQSLQVATASLNVFTASQDGRNFIISEFTSSTNAHIVGISDFTSSQLAVNLGNSIYTASVDSHIVGISTYTSSVRDTLARVHQTTQSLQVATASLQQFTASQDSRNFVVSQVTGSLIGITNGLMAFTAALDNTYATDAQLYQLYQATRSLELHSGSMIGLTNGLMAYTASNSTLNTGLRGEVDGIEAYTASLKGQAIVSSSTQVQNYDVFALNSNLYRATGSLIGITNGLMAFTAALDSAYATDAQLYQLYQATRSIELHSGSMVGITNGLMVYTSSNETWKTGVRGEISAIEAWTASLDSTYATDAQLYQLYAETASMKAEISGIEAYTASLKAAEIVSSSQQITNYYKFAETASATTTFYGNVTASGNIQTNQLYVGGATTSTGLIGASEAVVQNELGIQYGDATGTYMRLIANGANSNTAIQAGAFSGANPSLDLIASEGTTAISIKSYAGVTFNGAVTSSQSVSVGGTGFVSPNGADRFLGVYSGQDSSIILQDSVETWEMYMNDDLYFTTGSTSPKNVVSLRRGTGNVEINEGNLSVDKGNIIIGTAGKGIDFSATSNGSGTTSSEILSDYEEGTWTPVIRGDATAGTYEIASHYSHYTKVGRLVTLSTFIQLAGSLTGGGSGYLQITGVPFAKLSNSDASGTAWTNGVDTTGNYLVCRFTSVGASSTLFLSDVQDNGIPTDLSITSISASDSISFTINYIV